MPTDAPTNGSRQDPLPLNIPKPNPTLHQRPKPTYQTPQHKVAKPTYRKGQVWRVLAHPTQPVVGTEMWSNRPAVIVSADTLNNTAGFVQVVYLTTSTKKRSGPTHIPVPTAGPGTTALALCEQIHTVDISRLQKHMTTLSSEHMRDIDDAIALSLSLHKDVRHYRVFHKWEEYIRTNKLDLRKEIEALAGETETQITQALTNALELITIQRDAYRQLYETSQNLPEAMHHIVSTNAAQEPSHDA